MRRTAYAANTVAVCRLEHACADRGRFRSVVNSEKYMTVYIDKADTLGHTDHLRINSGQIPIKRDTAVNTHGAQTAIIKILPHRTAIVKKNN